MSLLQAQPLAWDRGLAQAAADYAQSLAAADCSLSHSAGALAGRYGENLYSVLLPAADSTCKTAVDIWYRVGTGGCCVGGAVVVRG